MAVISQYLVGDDIGKGLGVTFLIFVPLTALVFAFGLRPMRAAVRNQAGFS